MDNLSSNFSRRQLLKILASMPVAYYACGLSGCSNSGKKKDSLLKDINFYGTGTLDIQKKWAQVDKDLGLKIHFKDNGNEVGPVLTQMIVGTAALDYDIGGLQGGAERELAQAGKILPWNLEKIPNWKMVWDWAKDIPYAKFKGEQFGLPVVINADSIIYLPDKVGLVDSYSTIFNPEFKGKTAMEDSWINSVIFTAIYLKENGLMKIGDPGNLTSEELKNVMEFLIDKKKEGQFRTFWNGWEEGLRLILNEDVWAMTGWEPIVYAAQAKGKNVAYAIPKEGYEGWSNDLLLHIGAEKRGLLEQVHQFANWELDGFYGCSLGDLRGYAVPSDRGIDYAKHHPDEFDVKKYSSLLSNVREKFMTMKGRVHWQNVRPDNYREYEDWWSKLRVTKDLG